MKFRTASLIISLVGLADSIYLTWVKLTHNEAQCLVGVGDCATVNTSRYSVVAGIPVAVLGALAYLAFFILLQVEKADPDWHEYALYGQFGIALTGTLYSAYLTYLEIAVIQAICPFCIVSAVAMLALLLVTIFRLMKLQD